MCGGVCERCVGEYGDGVMGVDECCNGCDDICV